MGRGTCQYCGRPTATDICPAHGYVGVPPQPIPGEIAAGVPIGVVCMWSGAVADIPDGWVLCDGTSGTPNLTDKFVRGNGVQDPGATGYITTGNGSTVYYVIVFIMKVG